jgi:hypothetical protein
MKTFQQYNEGVKDLMTPKSEEDIRKALENLEPATKLLKSIQYGYFDIFQEIYEEYRRQINDDRNSKSMLFQEACRSGNFEVAYFMIEEGADVREYEDKALRISARGGHNKIVALLIGEGADIHCFGEDPLRSAIQSCDLKTVQILLNKGAIVQPGMLSLDTTDDIKNLLKSIFHKNDNTSKIKKFFGFNESIKDLMTPKSDDDVRRGLEKLPATKVIPTAKKIGVDIYDLYNEDEITELEYRIDDEFKEDIRDMKRKMNNINDTYKGDMTETSSEGNDYQIELNFPGNMSVYLKKEKGNEDFECGYELEPIGQTTRRISDWEETNNLNSCVRQITSWLDIHGAGKKMNEGVNLSCADCGGKTEAYFVKDSIWSVVPKSKTKRSLCLSCLEKRVGRKLKKEDFKASEIHNYQDWFKKMKE